MKTPINTHLAHFQQRGTLVVANDNGTVSRYTGWFRTTGAFDENIAYRKIGGRNWSYKGRTSAIVAFIVEK